MGQIDTGGAEGDRTPDLVIANDALSHLSYGPVPVPATPAQGAGMSIAISPEMRRAKGDFACAATASGRAGAGPPPYRRAPPVGRGCTTGMLEFTSSTGTTGIAAPDKGSATERMVSGWSCACARVFAPPCTAT